MKDKVLLLGVNGFTGKYFQEYLLSKKLQENFLFTGVDLKCEEKSDIKYISANVSEYSILKDIIVSEKPNYIINFIGLYSNRELEPLYKINSIIPHNIFQILANNKIEIKNLLLIGSAATIGNPKHMPVNENHPLEPLNYYGLTKLFQINFAKYFNKKYGINYSIARPFNLYGRGVPSSLALGAFIKKINDAKDKSEILVGNIKTKRDYLSIKDAVNAYWKILIHGKPCEIYNVCYGQSISIKNILTELIKNSGKSIDFKINPDWIRDDDVLDIVGDNSKIRNELKWVPKIEISSFLNEEF